MIEFTIPLNVTEEYGLNRFYSGTHWSRRRETAEFIHMLVWSQLKRQKVRKEILKRPVSITFSYNARLDCSNYAILNKMIEDALKGYLILDDSRKHVQSITTKFWDGEGIRVEIYENR